MAFKMFPWVPNGTYDSSSFLVRYVVVDGLPKTVLSKAWVDSGVPENLDDSLKASWGSFPDMPPKPLKK